MFYKGRRICINMFVNIILLKNIPVAKYRMVTASRSAGGIARLILVSCLVINGATF